MKSINVSLTSSSYEKGVRNPSLRKEEDIVISIRIGTNGLQRRLWELNTAKNI